MAMSQINDADYSESFPPIVGKNPRVVILGTMPGKESLRSNEYYANRRNLIWEIIYTLFGKQTQTEYHEKIKFLKESRIALWDVCHRARRRGSLDSDITDVIPNDLGNFIRSVASIEIIAFNGKKAEELYDRYFARIESLKYVTLLSTSPANACFTFEAKLENWTSIHEVEGRLKILCFCFAILIRNPDYLVQRILKRR